MPPLSAQAVTEHRNAFFNLLGKEKLPIAEQGSSLELGICSLLCSGIFLGSAASPSSLSITHEQKLFKNIKNQRMKDEREPLNSFFASFWQK